MGEELGRKFRCTEIKIICVMEKVHVQSFIKQETGSLSSFWFASHVR